MDYFDKNKKQNKKFALAFLSFFRPPKSFEKGKGKFCFAVAVALAEAMTRRVTTCSVRKIKLKVTTARGAWKTTSFARNGFAQRLIILHRKSLNRLLGGFLDFQMTLREKRLRAFAKDN